VVVDIVKTRLEMYVDYLNKELANKRNNPDGIQTKLGLVKRILENINSSIISGKLVSYLRTHFQSGSDTVNKLSEARKLRIFHPPVEGRKLVNAVQKDLKIVEDLLKNHIEYQAVQRKNV